MFAYGGLWHHKSWSLCPLFKVCTCSLIPLVWSPDFPNFSTPWGELSLHRETDCMKLFFTPNVHTRPALLRPVWLRSYPTNVLVKRTMSDERKARHKEIRNSSVCSGLWGTKLREQCWQSVWNPHDQKLRLGQGRPSVLPSTWLDGIGHRPSLAQERWTCPDSYTPLSLQMSILHRSEALCQFSWYLKGLVKLFFVCARLFGLGRLLDDECFV